MQPSCTPLTFALFFVLVIPPAHAEPARDLGVGIPAAATAMATMLASTATGCTGNSSCGTDLAAQLVDLAGCVSTEDALACLKQIFNGGLCFGFVMTHSDDGSTEPTLVRAVDKLATEIILLPGSPKKYVEVPGVGREFDFVNGALSLHTQTGPGHYYAGEKCK